MNEELLKAVNERVAKNQCSMTWQMQLQRSFATTSKQLMWFVVINGIMWIWCSYILAFIGHAQIAESLSTTVCTVVIGQVVMYTVSKTIENVYKHNNYGGDTSTTFRDDLQITSHEEISGP